MIRIADGDRQRPRDGNRFNGRQRGRQNDEYKMMKPIGQRATLITDLLKVDGQVLRPLIILSSSFCPRHSASHSNHAAGDSKMARLH